MTDKNPNSVWKNPIHFTAFGFGSGTLPIAPGTWGTLVGILFYVLIQDVSLSIYLSITAIAAMFGIWICHVTAKDIGVHDHSGIVWDEIVGYLLTMAFAPQGLLWIILGFILFRIFDILKPWPIKWIDQKVKGGLGIMLDDLLAAIPAGVILFCLGWIF